MFCRAGVANEAPGSYQTKNESNRLAAAGHTGSVGPAEPPSARRQHDQ
jgi:hypothetical protein